jgi:acetolactate synthase small subunit
VERELALIKVAAEPGTSRAEILQIAISSGPRS